MTFEAFEKGDLELAGKVEPLEECIDTTFVSSVGPFVDRFEKDIASYTGAARAVVCVSGINALHMSLLLSGVERDDEVLTQALTFIATCNAISYIGAHPVFLDVDRETLGLSPSAVRAWLENNAELREDGCYNRRTGRRVKACVPMHTFGHPVRIKELVTICEKWHIQVVEDAAESIGSLYEGQHTGTFAPIGALSFNGNKTITTGGGGMLLFQDGYNYRMPNINAALGCAQLENLDRYIESKRGIAAAYARFFQDMPGVQFFTEPKGCRSNYWLNAIILEDRAARDEFLEFSNDHGVMTRPVWELMNRLPMFEHCENDGLANSIWLADRIVNIPSSPKL